MPCNCSNCRRDNILNGTLVANCSCCSTTLSSTVPFQIMADTTLVCEPCIKQHYCSCAYCNKFFKTESMKDVKRGSAEEGTLQSIKVCETCYTNNYRECQHCHGMFDKHSVIAHDNKCYCNSCFRANYQMCSHCNTIRPKGSLVHKIRNGNAIVCENCFGIFGPICTYETKAELKFHGIPPHYYGTELEVELEDANRNVRGLKAQEVVDLFEKDFVITKEDGSIRCGFEIVTQPASLDEQRKRWGLFFDKLPKNLHSFNTTTCGLHVHCSKKPLSLLTIAKIVVFINDEKNKSFVETIAGRASCHHSCLQKKEHRDCITKNRTNDDTIEIDVRRGYSRYEAINLNNRDTIEFRIFKGTLKRESFFKAVEFCDALIRFCMPAKYSIAYCRDKHNFVKFVVDRKKDYPHLYAFICAKILKQENKLTKQFGFHVETPENANSQNVDIQR